MAFATAYFVQAFVMKRGKLAPGRRGTSVTRAGAVIGAKAWSTRMPGAVAVCVIADDETGELASATIVEQFGQVPDGFVEGLMGYKSRSSLECAVPTSNAEERAERREEKARKAADQAEHGAEARAEYDERARAVEANTARLKALRLERDAGSKADD